MDLPSYDSEEEMEILAESSPCMALLLPRNGTMGSEIGGKSALSDISKVTRQTRGSSKDGGVGQPSPGSNLRGLVDRRILKNFERWAHLKTLQGMVEQCGPLPEIHLQIWVLVPIAHL